MNEQPNPSRLAKERDDVAWRLRKWPQSATLGEVKLLAETVLELHADLAECRRVCESLAARCAGQSALLTRLAEQEIT